VSNSSSGELGEVQDQEVNAHLGNPGQAFFAEGETTVERVNGGPLPNFGGNFGQIARQTLPGPGADAFKKLANTDTVTYLVSTGVLDSTILTAYYPVRAQTISGFGQHRQQGYWTQTGLRFMAHYNNYGGPKSDKLRPLFEEADQQRDLGQPRVSLSYNALARRPYIDALIQVVEAAAPRIPFIHIYNFSGNRTNQRGTPQVAIYMAPDGTLFGSPYP
jgi:hypothetical protein